MTTVELSTMLGLWIHQPTQKMMWYAMPLGSSDRQIVHGKVELLGDQVFFKDTLVTKAHEWDLWWSIDQQSED